MSSTSAESSSTPGGGFQTLARLLAEDPRNPQLSYRRRRPGPLTPPPHPEAPLSYEYEIHLRLPAPLDDYVLAPLRLDDQDNVRDLVHMMNHPSIFPTLQSPPYPYNEEHAKAVLASGIQAAAPAHEVLLASPSIDDLHRDLRANPFSYVYYEPPAKPHGELGQSEPDRLRPGRNVGRCNFRAVTYPPTMDHPSAAIPTAPARSFSDVRWYTGYWLDADFAGKGLMSACVNAQIAFIRTLCRAGPDRPSAEAPRPPRFLASVWEHNPGSYRILIKAGFEVGARSPHADGKRYGFRDDEGSMGAVEEKHRGEPIMCLHLHMQE